jgi:hypothetical protein
LNSISGVWAVQGEISPHIPICQWWVQQLSFYLDPALFPTMMLSGVEVALDIPAPVGAALAVSETTPRFEGLQEQVATIFGELPVVDLFLHPGKILPLTLNVTFDATVTFAVMTITVR